MTRVGTSATLSIERGATGYLHPGYADSLSEFGTPIDLPRCGGRLLARGIPATSHRDAMGCYPLFACRDWSRLGDDLRELTGDLVSVTLVADPLGDHRENDLRACFDHVTSFKRRFVTELGDDPAAIVSRHHRYYARQALKRVHVRTCDAPPEHLDAWCRLYDHLRRRHELTGLQRFSREAFRKQLALDGLVMFAAYEQDRMIGAHLWMQHGHVAYSHLAACDEQGYDVNVSYALHWRALHAFHEGHFGPVRRLDLGAAAGTSASEDDGLARFKRGWANEERPTWLCGRILDYDRYRSLSGAPTSSTYFPAYRRGEFGLPSRPSATTEKDARPVYLRPLDMGDLERTHRWHNDAALYETLVGQFRPVSLETEREWLERVSTPSDDQANFAICLETGEHIGNIYLRNIDHTAGTAELHTFIAASSQRSRGYGKHAVNLLLDHAFDALKLQQVCLHVLQKNTPAIRCYARCGFRPERILRDHVIKDGRNEDVVLMIRDVRPVSIHAAAPAS